MDYTKKMEEIEGLWEDSFQICRAMIDACKAGDMKLNASLLKELNGFVKQSVDFLRYRESEQSFSEDAPQSEEDEALDRLLDEAEAELAEEDRRMDEQQTTAAADDDGDGTEELKLPPDAFTTSDADAVEEAAA